METPHVEPVPPDVRSVHWLKILAFCVTWVGPLLTWVLGPLVFACAKVPISAVALGSLAILCAFWFAIGTAIEFLYRRKARKINECRRMLGLHNQYI